MSRRVSNRISLRGENFHRPESRIEADVHLGTTTILFENFHSQRIARSKPIVRNFRRKGFVPSVEEEEKEEEEEEEAVRVRAIWLERGTAKSLHF